MTGRGAAPATGAGERGSATVWLVALAGLLAVVGVATVLVGAAVVGRHRAGAAADLAALAGAGRAVLGDPAACAVATTVAIANGASMDSCRIGAGAVVEVHVRVPVRLGLLGTVSARGRARAGPAPPVAHGGTSAGGEDGSTVAAAPTGDQDAARDQSGPPRPDADDHRSARARTSSTSAGDLGSREAQHYRATPTPAHADRRAGRSTERPAPSSAGASSAPTCDRSG